MTPPPSMITSSVMTLVDVMAMTTSSLPQLNWMAPLCTASGSSTACSVHDSGVPSPTRVAMLVWAGSTAWGHTTAGGTNCGGGGGCNCSGGTMGQPAVRTTGAKMKEAVTLRIERKITAVMAGAEACPTCR